MRGARGIGLACACLGWLACARTTDVFVGGDFEPAGGERDAGRVIPPADPPQAAAGAPAAGAIAQPAPPEAGVPDADADAAPPPEPCAPPRLDCDGDPENGCEQDVSADALHCGACGVTCPPPDCRCVSGERTLVCPAGRADCDGDVANGCEVDITSDAQHCGGCAQVCDDSGAGVASASCMDSRCVLTCSTPSRRGDCDGDPQNGCEADLFHDPDNCSMCGMQCSRCVDTLCL